MKRTNFRREVISLGPMVALTGSALRFLPSKLCDQVRHTEPKLIMAHLKPHMWLGHDSQAGLLYLCWGLQSFGPMLCDLGQVTLSFWSFHFFICGMIFSWVSQKWTQFLRTQPSRIHRHIISDLRGDWGKVCFKQQLLMLGRKGSLIHSRFIYWEYGMLETEMWRGPEGRAGLWASCRINWPKAWWHLGNLRYSCADEGKSHSVIWKALVGPVASG